MPFIPHTEKDTREMLAAIGVDSIEDLFDEIPAELRINGSFASDARACAHGRLAALFHWCGSV
jgi:glycine dehydrogenase subunit 1